MTRKPKVLFVIHDVYQDDNEFPLGPAYLGSVLSREGVDVKVLCADVYHYSDEQIGQFLRSTHFDVIGLGFLSARFKETVLPLCEEINRRKKNAWLVLGGHGPSPIPEYMLNKTKADVVAIGEAEDTIVELVRCKTGDQDLADVKGIAYRQDNEVYINEKRQPIKNLDSIPFPAWKLFPMKEYTTCMVYAGQTKDERSFQMITSRGCVGNCSFCYRMSRGIRFRSMENVVEEMKVLMFKYGVKYFEFQDELFLVNKKRLFMFRDALEQNRLKIKFYCQSRAGLLDKEMAECLKEMGCKKLNVGFESMNQKVLDAMNKHVTPEQNVETAELCNEVGLSLGLNFIWGNPHDTEQTLTDDVDFLMKYNTYQEIRTIRPVTPYPGCPLYYRAIGEGLLKDAEDFFDKFKNSDLLTVNFTDIPEQKFYKLLFEADKMLILNHYKHTNGNMQEARSLINDFYKLYFKQGYNFRGARHVARARVFSAVHSLPAEKEKDLASISGGVEDA